MKNQRLNITLTGEAVTEADNLRKLLEKRLMQRLSMAQITKRLFKIALEEELNTQSANS
jgi:hypothetical protein